MAKLVKIEIANGLLAHAYGGLPVNALTGTLMSALAETVRVSYDAAAAEVGHGIDVGV